MMKMLREHIFTGDDVEDKYPRNFEAKDENEYLRKRGHVRNEVVSEGILKLGDS